MHIDTEKSTSMRFWTYAKKIISQCHRITAERYFAKLNFQRISLLRN